MPRRRRGPRAVGLLLFVAAAVGVWVAQDAGLLRSGAPGTGAVHAGASGAGASAARPEGAVRVRVHSVHDGDTLRLSAPEVTEGASGEWRSAVGRESTRIVGIDAPEIGKAAECHGLESVAALRRLAPVGSTLWALPDEDPFDRYGRVLLNLWTDDGRLVPAELVAAGAARAIAVEPNTTYFTLLSSLEEAARSDGAGMWGSC